jgi:penicillin-binding protein 1A
VSIDGGRGISQRGYGCAAPVTVLAHAILAWMRRIFRAVAVFLLSAIAVPIATGTTVVAAFIFLPLPATLPEPKPGVESRITRVYDVDRNEIAIFREFEQSIPVQRGDIPLHLKQAVVAVEDRNFYTHGGVDVRGTFRAFWADVRNQRFVQGGSTITQQYVKNAYTGRRRTLVRKVREAVLAAQLDRQVDKDEILFRYLSTIYLGDGAYGVGAASESYFRKPVSQLTLSEAALLAGVIPAPSRYTPRGNPAGAEAKRRFVLQRMHQLGYITFEQLSEAHSQGIWLAGSGEPAGPATLVYPIVQQQARYPYFADYVRRYLEARFGAAKVFRGGLTVYTTIDSEMQEQAEKTVAAALKGTSPPLDMSLVAVEPLTGYVKALVGGRDFAASQVNLALGKLGGGSGRQPGSSFKPFVLARAFEEGVSPTKVYPAPNEYRIPGCRRQTGCVIHNYEGASFGRSDLRRGTWKSINTVYAQLVQDVGVKESAELARRMGITTSDPDNPNYGLSFALGAQEVSPLDMASAFSVFAGRGRRAEPTPVLRVDEPGGKVLLDNQDPAPKRVISELVADNVTDVLRGVITSGTGRAADIGRPVAGKTGTSQEWRDAWFVGYTPTLSTAVWMGYTDRPRPMHGIKGVRNVAGGTIPARTWHDFMVEAVEDVPVTDFSEPAPIRSLAADLKRRARSGIDPGGRRAVIETPANCGGPCEVGPRAPAAAPPPRSSPAAESPSSSEELPEDPGPSPSTTTPLVPGGGVSAAPDSG